MEFRIPLPKRKHVEEIFGMEGKPVLVGNDTCHEESACQCHAHHCGPGYKKFSRRSSINRSLVFSSNKDYSHFVIGHRGAGLNAPENSISAIKKCAARGCKMVEFDVSLTKDLVPVLFHDDNLLRITGVDRSISEISWDELKRIDISDKYPGERVPTLEEAVEACLALGLKFIIDIKDENEKLIEAIVNIFQRHKDRAYAKGVVSSFYFRVLYKIRARDPNILVAWPGDLFSTHCPQFTRMVTTLRMLVALMYAVNDLAMNYIYWWMIGLSAILVHKDALNVELVHRLRQRGLRVYAWTVNCPVEKQYLLNKLQVGYLTDTLDAEHSALPAAEKWLCNNNES
ncbi:Glycerophosphodiester phosphodiesterase 1 [Orchesella cincta]|uniref:Glycerophosphodiester phosphodiesterase 1 n=1 Tax=Orchesella cincta TaxID=48709 RepID=A0A1D2MT98_ORCCI|nr:Glycerophosphodiester phosphodiesterase 1 [Orchesella cincta]